MNIVAVAGLADFYNRQSTNGKALLTSLVRAMCLRGGCGRLHIASATVARPEHILKTPTLPTLCVVVVNRLVAGMQPVALPRLLQGWNTKTDPCTWGAKSGVGCDGGVTVSSM